MASGGVSSEWHKSTELTKQLDEFTQKYAKFPKEGLDAAKSLETSTLMQIRDQMKRMADFNVKEFQYTGSIYEGLKIGTPDEFDIMVIIDAGEVLNNSVKSNHGFFHLKPDGQTLVKYASCIVDGNLSSVKIMDKFFSFVVKALQELELNDRVIPRKHGPAVQIDMEARSVKFSIDIVPSFKVGSELYVPKAPKSSPHAWRRSTSLQEKEILKTIDQGNGIRRQSVRILKALREKEPVFKVLETYHLKTALLHVNNNKKGLSWTPKDLGARVMDLLGFIQDCLEKGRMPQFFMPQMNLLEGKHCGDLSNRIKRLMNNQAAFTKLISSKTKDEL